MPSIVEIDDIHKTYDDGIEALKGITLDIEEGEILALLGPNGAGKTTLISTICGITLPTSGRISVGGHDVQSEWRAARKLIGLVPQEINLEPFELVQSTLRYSRGLFGKPRNEALLADVLKDLALLDRRGSRTSELSGGMRRRVLIAKALSHEPRVLFLDEPTAGVDVELRRDMWMLVERLRQDGVTVILTTHYIEEAEAIADRVGVINDGELLLIEEKSALMQRLGRKEVRIELTQPVEAVPDTLAEYDLVRSEDGRSLTYSYKTTGERTGITRLLTAVQAAGLTLADIQTRQSSLEEIFVRLVREDVA
ncbi:MAG: ABC transporter ATP-binding protein [Boseongicola sp.]|nr:ABC transporter ATP-binding protein [Boseongicola sp.]MDE0347149.1 ABC transporter ATP-binding protein [Boseongicola sp.]MXW86590.1 ABC transporter ATP-binding protein [Boseongicola sp. SB0667_bin_21]